MEKSVKVQRCEKLSSFTSATQTEELEICTLNRCEKVGDLSKGMSSVLKEKGSLNLYYVFHSCQYTMVLTGCENVLYGSFAWTMTLIRNCGEPRRNIAEP